MDEPRSDLFDDHIETQEGALVHDFTLVRRGYDPEEVNDHLRSLSVRIEALERQLRDAEGQLTAMRRGSQDVWKNAYRTAKEELYDRFASRLSEILKTADRIADEARHEAEESATATMTRAETESQRVLGDARREADELKRDAEEARARAEVERDTILRDLESRRAGILREVYQAADRLGTAVSGLRTLLPGADVPGGAQSDRPAQSPAPSRGEPALLEVPDLNSVVELAEERDQPR
ncbi:MAG TPA: DivIVA domain-containing protein [Actinomycetota bacterium]|nr:DivIVA domain-containing protein [Actinomycetota bacterium]